MYAVTSPHRCLQGDEGVAVLCGPRQVYLQKVDSQFRLVFAGCAHRRRAARCRVPGSGALQHFARLRGPACRVFFSAGSGTQGSPRTIAEVVRRLDQKIRGESGLDRGDSFRQRSLSRAPGRAKCAGWQGAPAHAAHGRGHVENGVHHAREGCSGRGFSRFEVLHESEEAAHRGRHPHRLQGATQ